MTLLLDKGKKQILEILYAKKKEWKVFIYEKYKYKTEKEFWPQYMSFKNSQKNIYCQKFWNSHMKAFVL